MKQRIRIAQIGIGHNHAADKMIALRKLPELFEVVGFSEDDPRWLKERGGFEAYQGLPRFSEQELLNLPGLDAVSLGPELHDVHSVRERLSVPSTERVYELVCEVLRRSR